MRRFGQAAAEMITILGVALVVMVLFFVLSANMLTGARVQQNYDDAHTSVAALVEAADSVYSQGEGAVRKVSITLPGDTIFGGNTTFIGRPSNQPLASQNGISINVNGTTLFGQTEASLVGQFPTAAGKYSMRVTSRGAYVEIYPYLVDIDKYSVTIVTAQNETRSTSLTVTRSSGEAVTLQPTMNWGFSGVNLTLSPSGSFAASEYGSQITFTVNSGSAAPGMYNSQLTLTATGATSGTTETINIPISINVRT